MDDFYFFPMHPFVTHQMFARAMRSQTFTHVERTNSRINSRSRPENREFLTSPPPYEPPPSYEEAMKLQPNSNQQKGQNHTNPNKLCVII